MSTTGGIGAINVNGIPHQAMWRIENLADPFYEQVYRWFPDRTSSACSSSGAGSGTDVAVALAHGAGRVDAVEIDARIQEIGQRDHPNKPYDDPRVTRINDDGRAFLRRTTNQYDLVVFALPDSLTLVSTSANLRLESFLFTSEAFDEVRGRLTPDGIFVLYNFYREDWLPQKIAGMLEGSFGSPPMARIHGDRRDPRRRPLVESLAAGPPGDSIDPIDLGSAPAAATDDWPFLYLGTGSSRRTNLALAIIVAFAVLLVARAARRSGTSVRQFSPHFFVLGHRIPAPRDEEPRHVQPLVRDDMGRQLRWCSSRCSPASWLAIVVNQRVQFRNPMLLYAALFGSIALADLLPPASC